MRAKPKIIFAFLMVLIITFSIGCGLIPQGVKNLLVSETPQPEILATATNTSEPTQTIEAVKTASPPLEMVTCAFSEDCSTVSNANDLLGESFESDRINELEILYDQPLRLSIGWVAADEETLQDNLKHMQWFLTIDGKDFFQEKWLSEGSGTSSTQDGASQWIGVVLDGFKKNQSYFVEIGFVLTEAINDGWNQFDSGYVVKNSYFIIPVEEEISTATPQPTATKANAAPTSTKGAVILPSATSSEPLELNITIKVTNLCAEQHVVVMTGPMRLKYTVDPGKTVEYSAATGTYSWLIDNTYQGGPQDLFESVWTLTLCQ